MPSLGPESCKLDRQLEEMPEERLSLERMSTRMSTEVLAVDELSSAMNLSNTMSSREEVHLHDSSRSRNSIRNLLINTKTQGRLRQRRVRIPTISGGVFFVSVSLVTTVVYEAVKATMWLEVVVYSTLILGSVLLLLALLPSDHRAVRFVVAFGIAACVGRNIMSVIQCIEMYIVLRRGEQRFCALREIMVPCWFNVVRICNRIVWALAGLHICAKWVLALSQKVETIILLSLSWKLVGVIFFAASFSDLTSGVVSCWVADITFVFRQFVRAVCFAVIGYVLVFVPNFRHNVQSWLVSRGGAVASAALVAEMLSGQNALEVLHTAKQTFSSVSAKLVSYKDMQSNTPNAELSGLRIRSKLGSVDAFVSHSWHDDPNLKWRALQKFRTDFKLKHGREPMLWIDKYCIDQNDIDKSLAALPVFLSGCHKMLLICGETYLHRLWCLLEIFVFLEMGGQVDNLEVYILGRPDDFTDSLINFSVSSARCFDPKDQIRLTSILQVNEAGVDFIVRSAFSNRMENGCFIAPMDQDLKRNVDIGVDDSEDLCIDVDDLEEGSLACVSPSLNGSSSKVEIARELPEIPPTLTPLFFNQRQHNFQL